MRLACCVTQHDTMLRRRHHLHHTVQPPRFRSGAVAGAARPAGRLGGESVLTSTVVVGVSVVLRHAVDGCTVLWHLSIILLLRSSLLSRWILLMHQQGQHWVMGTWHRFAALRQQYSRPCDRTHRLVRLTATICNGRTLH